MTDSLPPQNNIEQVTGKFADFISEPGLLLLRPFPTNASIIGRSKQGGLPNLPSEYEWPEAPSMYKKDELGTPKMLPMHFIAQIDCSELPELDNLLPTKGMLFFFGLFEDGTDFEIDKRGNPRTALIFAPDVPKEAGLRKLPKTIEAQIEGPANYCHPHYVWSAETDGYVLSEWPLLPILAKTHLFPTAFSNDREVLNEAFVDAGLDGQDVEAEVIWERYCEKYNSLNLESLKAALKPLSTQLHNVSSKYDSIRSLKLHEHPDFPFVGAFLHDYAVAIEEIAKKKRRPSFGGAKPNITEEQDQHFSRVEKEARDWIERVKINGLQNQISSSEAQDFKNWVKNALAEAMKLRVLQSRAVSAERATSELTPFQRTIRKLSPKRSKSSLRKNANLEISADELERVFRFDELGYILNYCLNRYFERAANQPAYWEKIPSAFLDIKAAEYQPFAEYIPNVSLRTATNYHQMFGNCYTAQVPPLYRDTRLTLFQYQKGGGQIYFMIEPEDLSAQRFDRHSIIETWG
jgi:hypothetical protein